MEVNPNTLQVYMVTLGTEGKFGGDMISIDLGLSKGQQNKGIY